MQGTRFSARIRALAFGAVIVCSFGGFAAAQAATSSSSSPADESTVLEGKLLVAHGDDFSGKNMIMQARLRTADGTVKVKTNWGHAKLMPLAGMRVKVRGHKSSATTIDATNITTTEGAAAAPAAAAPRNIRIALVLMHLRNSSTEPYAKSYAETVMTDVKNWYEEASGGNVTVTTKVYGYYDSTVPSGNCDLSRWTSEGANAARADGYSANNYDHIVVYSPKVSGSGCNFSGIAWVGRTPSQPANGVYLNGSLHAGVIEHEVGHNLSFWHAGTVVCDQPVTFAEDCDNDEYGDPYDVMGNAGGYRHYNAQHKAWLGWIPPSSVVDVTNGSRTIDLTAHERPNVPGTTELIRVKGSDGYVYAVERRESFGYDTGLSGVWVRVVLNYGGDDTMLLDMAPNTSTFTDGRLAVGKTFTGMPGSNVTIKTLSDSGPTASIQVCIGPCSGGPVTTTTSTTSTTTTTKPTTTSTTTTTIASPPPPPGSSVSVSVVNNVLRVQGSASRDVVTITKVRNNKTRVYAAGAQIVVGLGCSRDGVDVYCKGRSIEALLGDGNDAVTVVGKMRSILNGGAGNDWFVGGRAADVFIGGSGVDTVDYSDRTGDVHVSIGTGADDGSRRERDDIRADIEGVLGPAG